MRRTCPHCGKEIRKKPTKDAESVDYSVVPCSPEAAKHVEPCDNIEAGICPQKGKYPFNTLKIGYSFCELLSKRGKLASVASVHNKKKVKRFKVIAHDDLGLCEIVRIK